MQVFLLVHLTNVVQQVMHLHQTNTAVARMLIGGGGVYSYIHVLSDEFLLKSNSNLSI